MTYRNISYVKILKKIHGIYMNEIKTFIVADSFVKKNLKKPGAGSGYAKFYVGSSKTSEMDDFFNHFNSIQCSFNKENLLQYVDDVLEYYLPTLDVTITHDAFEKHYALIKESINSLVEFNFSLKKYTDAYRYYISTQNKLLWDDIFRSAALPKITKLEIEKSDNQFSFNLLFDKTELMKSENISEIIMENERIKSQLDKLNEEIKQKDKDKDKDKIKELKTQIEELNSDKSNLNSNTYASYILKINESFDFITDSISLENLIKEIDSDISRFNNIAVVGLVFAFLSFGYFSVHAFLVDENKIVSSTLAYLAGVSSILFPTIISITFFSLSHKKLLEKQKLSKNKFYTHNMKGILFAMTNLLKDKEAEKEDETIRILREMSETFQQQNTLCENNKNDESDTKISEKVINMIIGSLVKQTK